jgi:hypothetical protein
MTCSKCRHKFEFSFETRPSEEGFMLTVGLLVASILLCFVFSSCETRRSEQQTPIKEKASQLSPSSEKTPILGGKTGGVKGVLVYKSTSKPLANQQVYLLRVKQTSTGETKVEFTGEEIQTRGQTHTNDKGEFHFKDVLPGTYALLLIGVSGFEQLKTSQGFPISITIKENDPVLDLDTVLVKSE